MFFLSLDNYPEVELLDHMLVLFLIFWGTPKLCFTVSASIYIPTNLYSTALPTLVISHLFDKSYSNSVRLCLIVALICIPLNISNIEHLYMYLLASYIAFLEKSPFRFVHFVVRLFRGFFGWVLDWMSSLHILDISSLSDIHFAIIFSYSVCSLFIFKWFSLLCRNIFAILK